MCTVVACERSSYEMTSCNRVRNIHAQYAGAVIAYQLVRTCLAVSASKAGNTRAAVAAHCILARCTVTTRRRVGFTFIRI